MIDGTPSLWNEFVWPYYDSREECSVKEVLKVCGQHIKVLALPNCSRAPSTLVEMLQYCSNVKHLRLPSTVVARDNLFIKGLLDPKLRKAICHMKHLQTLEIGVHYDSNINTSPHLSELTMYIHETQSRPFLWFKNFLAQWKDADCRPLNINVFVPVDVLDDWDCCIDEIAAQFNTPLSIPIGTNANFRVYGGHHKVPFNLSPSLPHNQLQLEGSG